MEKIKAFQVRLPHSIWLFLKHQAATQERSMNDIIQACVEKYKKRIEKNVDNE